MERRAKESVFFKATKQFASSDKRHESDAEEKAGDDSWWVLLCHSPDEQVVARQCFDLGFFFSGTSKEFTGCT